MTHRLSNIKDKLIKLEKHRLRIEYDGDRGYCLQHLANGRWQTFATSTTFEDGLGHLEQIYHDRQSYDRVVRVPPPNPYPTEWAARQTDPDQYARFRRKSVGHGISLVVGFPHARRRKPGRGESEVQSVRFAKSRWTRRQAEEWLREHDFRDSVE